MITVHHSAGSYPVYTTRLDDLYQLMPDHSFVLTDTNLAPLYGRVFRDLPMYVVPAGESSKGIEAYAQVIGWLAEAGASRRATVVAFGGGVVGDLGGFVAATYMRGVRLIQVPTSLLAMVDSSVGGKVGVDLPQGKNLVGAFAPPEQVHVPIESLETLPEREFLAGMAEVCKYGFIMDPPLADALSRERVSVSDILPIVETCITHKGKIVGEDEFETKGLRATLNFGHTVGHAIEQVTGYGPVLHGEAIAVGMRVEAELAVRLGVAEPELVEQIARCLEVQGLRTRLGLQLDRERLIEAMRRDKKRSGSGLPFSLVTEIGRCKLYTGIDEGDIAPLLDDL